MRGAWLDGLATAASAACLIHCVAVPVAAVAIPSLIGAASGPEWLHAALLLFAYPVGIAALVGGYRAHGQVGPAALGALGLFMMTAGLVAHDAVRLETGLTAAGVSLVGIAHLRNWRLRRRREAPCAT